MRLAEIRDKLMQKGKLTPLGWIVVVAMVVVYYGLKKTNEHRIETKAAAKAAEETLAHALPQNISTNRRPEQVSMPETPLPPVVQTAQSPVQGPPAPQRLYNQPSFGNLNQSNKILSDDFLPKGTILYATLTSDIVSNNQVSPATATLIHPAIFAHGIRVPVGTQITGRIAPGNLRGRVFVTWDTLIFYEEGRQGWELPIKGIGMSYAQNPESGRWIINGAGLKGYFYDDSSSTAFKLAALRGMQDFSKTLQTFITTQNSAITAGSALTTTTTTPEATLKNSGLAAAEGFFDVIASRYAAQLQQNNSYVLVPTARMCAIFLDEPIDITTAAPGRSMQAQK